MDIRFENSDTSVFNYRTAAIILNGNKILLHKVVSDDCWTLIGGKVEMLESSDYAIKREIREELEEEIEIEKIIWFVENFFEREGQRYHELSTVYLVSLSNESQIKDKDEPFYGSEDNRLCFKWFNINEMKNLQIKPNFLIEKLNPLPDTLEHLIHRDA